MPSCTDDDGGVAGDGHQYVTFTVSTPFTSPSTYAMSSSDENAIQAVDVLAFKVVGTDTTFVYRSTGYQITTQTDETIKKFEVKLRKNDGNNYIFAVIANAGTELNAATMIEGTAKSAVLSFLLSRNSNQWDTSANFTPFPMWGETQNTMQIVDNTTAIGETVKLLRSVLSIDMQVGSTVQSTFKLKEVYIYNRKTRGRITPIAAHYDKVNQKVTAASMPTDSPSDPLTILDGLRYESSSVIQLKNTIYTYEAPAVANDKTLKATCLVVGGVYDTDTDTTYYRLDFAEYDVSNVFQNYLPLLRNHKYTFTIQNVSEGGYPTPDEAFYGKKASIIATIQIWNLGDMPDVEVSEDYYLKVSQSSFNISKDEYKGKITVETDYPVAWTAISNDGWITVSDVNSSSFKFTVTENTGGTDRVGTITITVGNLTKTIKISQSAS